MRWHLILRWSRWPARPRAGEPFRMLVAGAAPVGDALAAQKGDIALHTICPSGQSGTDRAG